MKPSHFLKISIVLSASILGLAGYLLTSNPALIAGPAVTQTTPSSELTAPSPEQLSVVSESEAPKRLAAPTRALRTEKAALKAFQAPRKENTELGAREASTDASANSPTTPDSSVTPADADANAPLPVPLPAAIVSGEVPAALPLALVSPDPDTQLNQLQQMGMDSLRKAFIDAVGGPNQDTKDPAYLRRWLDATKELDARYKLYFGWDAAAQQQARAVQQAGGVKAYFEQLAAAQAQQQNSPR